MEISDADRTFVAKVSQGGMFEVEASKVAESKAVERDVVDVSFTEVHDHELVGAKLKSIAGSLGLPFPSALNAAFTKRLDRLQALSGKAFDDAYITEMDAIHAVDVFAFAKEAESGTNPSLKAFAAETVLIVRRHIGALHAVPLPTR
jgi:putative membrane protein